MKIPVLDLSGQYRQVRREVLREIEKVCDSQRFVLGPNVSALETEIASYSGARYGVGCGSGTDALILALMASGVGPGDGVVTTPYTFFSTAGAISLLGARPVFVDIDPATYNIDPDGIRACLKRKSKGVKAVIPVHLYGQTAEMDPIKKTARRYGLKVIEDAAQAIGAEYRGRRAGSIGDVGCFSFYPSKNLGGFGDGGMLTTGSKKTAETLRMLRVHGSNRRYYHTLIGTNARLDEMQAAVLRVKFRYLEGWTGGRIKKAARYDALFKKAGLSEFVTLPVITEGNRSVFNQYVLRVKKRNRLREHLSKKGVSTEVYYPVPLHLQKSFSSLGYKKGDFPESERAARETVALPMYPELKDSEIKYVVAAIAGFYSKGGGRR
ncbi:MAG: DegT/DnrJ/EryC1/StrS family aminotransferase [Thermodesulfobacteriota bacterium]